MIIYKDSVFRWWKGAFNHKRRIVVLSNEGGKTIREGARRILRKPSKREIAFEQLELHARRERRKRLDEQAVAAFGSKPSRTFSGGSPPSSPRVIGTRRRRSRGGSYDTEMQGFTGSH